MSISTNVPSDMPPDAATPDHEGGDVSPESPAGASSGSRPKQEPSTGAGEEARVLEHEYDGILEYDNPMPAWWKNMFWGSFVFSLGYLFWFHLGGNGVSVQAAYDADVAEAQARAAEAALGQEVSEDGLQQLMADAGSMEDAGAKFAASCAPCHADKGQGLIGPNLTDAHWIHGSGNLMEIYDVVAKGVPDKGMPPWERQLTPEDLKKIVAFVGAMRGTNVPGKAPEGNPAAPSP